jgi:heterotetrameric sarcosine oxidase gamma subunit
VPDAAISSHNAGIVQIAAFNGSGEAVSAIVGRMHDRADVVEIGPGRWWLISADDRAGALDGLDAGAAAVVDLSSSRIVVRLRHPRWRDVVAKGCGIDLSSARFVRQSYAATSFARFNVLLRVPDGKEGCDLYVARSCADSLRRWLEDALVEFGDA